MTPLQPFWNNTLQQFKIIYLLLNNIETNDF